MIIVSCLLVVPRENGKLQFSQNVFVLFGEFIGMASNEFSPFSQSYNTYFINLFVVYMHMLVEACGIHSYIASAYTGQFAVTATL